MRRYGVRYTILLALALAACGHKNGTSGDAGGGGGGDSATDSNGAGCGLTTCQSQGATCGPIGDGCGGVLDCGTCPNPGDTCGGGGQLFTCGNGGGSGSGACTPHGCGTANCGVVADGCGGVTASCGTCSGGQVCGAGGTANVCATPVCTTGLCTQQNACTGMAQLTTISGTVTAPGHPSGPPWGNNWKPDPIYGALVYVPNGSAGAPTWGVTDFTPGVSCDSCTSLVTGNPLVSFTTGVDGKFTIQNAPCGTNIPLVIQLGRWRRQIVIPSVTCCADNALTNTQTHLPRDHVGETGDVRSEIPLMAFSTGDVDTLHCVVRKIGVADSEFTNPSGTGRVRFYKDNGAKINNSTPSASTLVGSQTELDKYDLALFECHGGQVDQALADQNRVISFADNGGRVFATHYEYVWLNNQVNNGNGTWTGPTAPDPWDQVATWAVDKNGDVGNVTGTVDQTLQGDPNTQTRRVAFASWLTQVGASTTPGQIPVNVVRNDYTALNTNPATKAGTPVQQWLYSTSPAQPLHFTFDTPIAYSPNPAPTTQCGRVLFSDFHVSDASSNGSTFPNECNETAMNAQEQTLEFMLFDLASCVGPPPGACTPKTCMDFGFTCGQSGDGCDDGVILNCGTCGNGQTCGGGGPNMCGSTSCMPQTCASVGAMCGIIGDGCGGTADCGPCPQGQSCGAGGMANQCAGVF